MSREEFLTTRLAERSAEMERLRTGIQDYLDGNYGRDQHFKTKHDKCPHNLFGWETCENCIDAYFTALLKNELVSDLRCPDCTKDRIATIESCAKIAAGHNGISPKDSRDIATKIRRLNELSR
jgi:hypothetical protein